MGNTGHLDFATVVLRLTCIRVCAEGSQVIQRVFLCKCSMIIIVTLMCM